MRSKRITKLEHSKKTIALLVALLLLLTVGVGTTVAFLVDQTTEVVNTFTPGTVSGKIEEGWTGSEKTNVKIGNTSLDVAAYIRAMIVVTWKDANGNVYAQTPELGVDYEMTLANDGWFKCSSDGYYYYSTAVVPLGETGVLISSCTEENSAPEGYKLSVEILASAIQAEPTDAVEEAWHVTVATDGTISK